MRAPGAGTGRWAWEMLLASTWRKHILNWRWYVHHLREQHLHPRPLSLHAAGVEEQEASLEAGLERSAARAARPHHLPGAPRQHDPKPLGPHTRAGDRQGDNKTCDRQGDNKTRDTPDDVACALSLVFVFVGTNSLPHYVLLAVEQASARHTADT